MNKMLIGYNFGKLSVAIIPATQAKAEKDDWATVDPTTLPSHVQNAYKDYKDAYQVMKEAREVFEQMLREETGIVSPTKVATKGQTKPLSMADLMAMNGRGR